MSNPLDQLFKNKLTDHTLAPSVNAWDRVRGGLAKKNNRPVLVRMAAAVLLVGALTTTLLWLSSNDPDSNVSSISKKGESKTDTANPIPSSNPPAGVEKQSPAEKPVSKKKKATPLPIEKEIETSRTNVEDQNHVAQSEITTNGQTLPPSPSEVVTLVASRTAEEKPIVLEYRLETIDPTPVVETAAVPEPKEKSGLLKVIDFARDAKNGDGRLGDLRQAKDELFAFNFKKEKQNNHK